MSNTITIIFQPCEPAPSGGYRVQYRPVGSSDPYTLNPTAYFSSPIVFDDGGANPDGTEYEGVIYSDCGDGVLGNPVNWSSEECVPVSIPAFELPDGYTGIPYEASFNLIGTAPFVLSAITKPAWMTISVVGNLVTFSGTPDAADPDVDVLFTASNCGGSANFVGSFEVIFANFIVENLTTTPQQHQVTSVNGFPPLGATILEGVFPVLPGQRLIGVHPGFSGVWLVTVTDYISGSTPNKKVVLRKNGVLVDQENLPTGGNTMITSGVTLLVADILKVEIVNV